MAEQQEKLRVAQLQRSRRRGRSFRRRSGGASEISDTKVFEAGAIDLRLEP